MADFDKAEAKRNAVPVKNLAECSFCERKNGMECKDFKPSIIQDDKILKVAKRLKTFTPEDIVIFCEIDSDVARKFLQESENIKPVGNKFEYVESVKTEEKFKIIDKNIECKNSDITVVQACKIFLKTKQRTLTEQSYQAYKTFVYSKIIPYFKDVLLKNITIQYVQSFKRHLQENNVTEPRIKNILALLNQIIKHFQNEGYIEKTCIFEVKRIANIPKRQIQILSPEQMTQIFRITRKRYPYLISILHKMITLKQPLNSILTGNEQQKKFLKRRIRKDFYKIKQEMGLENYKIDDLRHTKY